MDVRHRQFLQVYLQSSEAANTDDIVKGAKKKIYAHFYGQSKFPKIDLASARKAVNEYTKILKDYPYLIAELKLYYLEVGTGLSNDYGDIDEGFYSSLESMFDSFCSDIVNRPHYYPQFRDRIDDLQLACEGIGWGYRDVIDDIVFELEAAMDSLEDKE